MTDELLEIADELYALPPGEFTAARDAKAKELIDAARERFAGVYVVAPYRRPLAVLELLTQ